MINLYQLVTADTPKTDVNLTCVEGKHVAKRPKLDIPLSEQVLMSTIPYHSIEYEEQVSKPFDASVPTTSICIIIIINRVPKSRVVDCE